MAIQAFLMSIQESDGDPSVFDAYYPSDTLGRCFLHVNLYIDGQDLPKGSEGSYSKNPLLSWIGIKSAWIAITFLDRHQKCLDRHHFLG